jgi:defect-in-organelle-trafficking protein DotD
MMDMKRLFSLCFLSFFIAACSSTTSQKDSDEIKTQNANIQMSQAATTVSNSLTDIGSMQRATTPPLAMKNLPDPNTYNMDALGSVDWSGPVEPIVQQIANASHYKVVILGKPPAIPVLVSITEKNMPLGYILRDIDFQCANKANIVVFPERRVIELRYAH